MAKGEMYEVDVLTPDAVSRVVRYKRPASVPDQCCYDEFQVAYDVDGYPLVLSLDNFLCDPETYVKVGDRGEFRFV